MSHTKLEREGLMLGFFAVALFSLTMPMTKMALESFHPYVTGLARTSIAGVLGAIYLITTKKWHLYRPHWKDFSLVMAGVAFGFPICTSMALSTTTAAHAGIVLAIMPLITAVMGSIFLHERHSWKFWMSAVIGCLTVLAYTMQRAGVAVSVADVWLFGAAISGGLGYSVGARMTKHMNGMDVISGALAMALPVTIPAAVYVLTHHAPENITMGAAFGLAYIAIISQLLGFVPWYKGLAMGGVALVSQLQLLQVFMTLIICSLVLHEAISWVEYAVAALVVAEIVIARRFY